MHLEKFQVDKIQNGRLSAIIHLDRPDIVEYHENHSRYLHQVQNGRQSAIIHFHMAVFWWTVLDG